MEPRQYKMLSRIRKAEIYDFGNDSEEERSIVRYLLHQNYIKYIPIDDDEPVFTAPHRCKITQEGKAALYEWRVDKLYRLAPTYLAIFASVGGYREELALIVRVLARLWRQLTGN